MILIARFWPHMQVFNGLKYGYDSWIWLIPFLVLDPQIATVLSSSSLEHIFICILKWKQVRKGTHETADSIGFNFSVVKHQLPSTMATYCS